jgi:hypothetical protein
VTDPRVSDLAIASPILRIALRHGVRLGRSQNRCAARPRSTHSLTGPEQFGSPYVMRLYGRTGVVGIAGTWNIDASILQFLTRCGWVLGHL